jgi:hypothetical protein
MDACRRGGHDVLVVGPPVLAEPVRDAGYSLSLGAAPSEDELAPVWARIATLSHEDAERLVMAEMFATLNVRAMLPAMRAAVRAWRPDVIVRESAEFTSAIVAEEAGVPHAQVAISLIATHMKLLLIAAEAVDAWRTGLSERLAATPYLTQFPASLEDPEVTGPAPVHRFRDESH